MSPTVAAPLDFTAEALGLAAAGLLLIWATWARARWVIVGALALGAGQAILAAQLAEPGTASATVALGLRLGGLAAVAIGAIGRPRGIVAMLGAAVVAAGGLWGFLEADHSVLEIGVAPRLLLLGGFAALMGWAWVATAGSIRSRFVAVAVGVLAVAIIVAGGAVTRTAASDEIDVLRERLERVAVTETANVQQGSDAVARRTALAATVLGTQPDAAVALDELRVDALADLDVLGLLHPDEGFVVEHGFQGAEADAAASAPVVGFARGAGVSSGITDTEGTSLVLAVAPVPDHDPLLIVAGSRITDAALGEVAANAGTDVSIALMDIDGVHLAGQRLSDRAATAIRLGAERRVRRETLTVDGLDHLAVAVRIGFTDPPDAALVFIQPLTAVASGSGLQGALVGGILSAGLLGLIVALWLSARIARPVVDLADQVDEAKADFLARVNHELRTPLTPIRGYTELLRQTAPRRQAGRYLDEMEGAVGRLERVITLMADVAAMSSDRFEVDAQPVGLRDMVDRVVERWRSEAPDHRFVVKVPKATPRVAADGPLIERVIDELVSNAVRFSPDGGTVTIRAKRDDEGVECSVTDEGVGVDPDHLAQLTSAFGQAPDREHVKGMGLGLTFVSGVLDAHGSELGIASDGDGAVFSFRLPTAGMVSRMSRRAR